MPQDQPARHISVSAPYRYRIDVYLYASGPGVFTSRIRAINVDTLTDTAHYLPAACDSLVSQNAIQTRF